jgi:hypothetical protein
MFVARSRIRGMAMKLVGKLVIVVVLAAAVFAAWKWRGERIAALQNEPKAPATITVSRIQPGAISVDGLPAEWDQVRRYTLFDSGRDSDWRYVYMAHDGTNLYILLSLNGEVEPLIQQSVGASGVIYMDSDCNSQTGFKDTVVENGPAYDYGLHLRCGIDKTSKKPYVGYLLERCEKDGKPIMDLKSQITSLSHPNLISCRGQCIEMCVPMASLGLKAGTKVPMTFQPTAAGDYILYTVERP